MTENILGNQNTNKLQRKLKEKGSETIRKFAEQLGVSYADLGKTVDVLSKFSGTFEKSDMK